MIDYGKEKFRWLCGTLSSFDVRNPSLRNHAARAGYATVVVTVGWREFKALTHVNLSTVRVYSVVVEFGYLFHFGTAHLNSTDRGQRGPIRTVQELAGIPIGS